jgi:hypothetical protein
MITLILLLAAGILNAVMDKIAFNYKSSIFKDLNPRFWDVKQSWKNQWKWPLEPYTGWYYFGLYTSRYKENFPYSNTFLVWATDAWHLAKALMLGCIMLGIVFYSPMFGWLIDAVIYYCIFTLAFTYFYSYILKAK